MIEPPPEAFISGSAYLQPKNVPSTWIAMCRRKLSAEQSSTDSKITFPALLTRISSRPWSLSTSPIISCQRASSRTSWTKAWPPTASATACALARSISVTTTLAPSSARRIASALPSPIAPPVIKATLPATRPAMLFSPDYEAMVARRPRGKYRQKRYAGALACPTLVRVILPSPPGYAARGRGARL
jgi:hypothetical protein